MLSTMTTLPLQATTTTTTITNRMVSWFYLASATSLEQSLLYPTLHTDITNELTGSWE